jgi:hypothetical protein
MPPLMTRNLLRLAFFALLSTIGSAQIVPVHGTGTAATIANATGVFAPGANIAAVFNPAQVDGAGMPVDGAVGDNGSGTARVYHQVAAYNVATLLTALGLGTDAAALSQLANFTFTISGSALDSPDVDLDDAFFYHAACIGSWQDDGTPPLTFPSPEPPFKT